MTDDTDTDFDFELPGQEATIDDHVREIVEAEVERAMDAWMEQHEAILREHLVEGFAQFYADLMKRFKADLPNMMEASSRECSTSEARDE